MAASTRLTNITSTSFFLYKLSDFHDLKALNPPSICRWGVFDRLTHFSYDLLFSHPSKYG